MKNYFYSYLILLWFLYSRSCSTKRRFVGLLDCWSMLMFKMSLRFLKKKNRKWYEHLLEWHFIPSSYFESRGEDPSRTRFRIDCVSMQIHLLQAAVRSIVHIVTNRLMRPCRCSQKMRGHIYPSTRRIKSIDRCIDHHHCLLRHDAAQGRGLFPVVVSCLHMQYTWIYACIILRTTGARKKCHCTGPYMLRTWHTS